MPRGGKREGSGGKPTWKHGKTKTIRVPDALATKVLEIARIIDEGNSGSEDFMLADVETDSKVIDLAGVAILHSKDGPVVRLSDLIRVGYSVKPERLVRNLRPRRRETLE